MSGSTPARPTPRCSGAAREAPAGRPTSTSRGATSTAAGSSPRSGPRSSPTARRPTGPSSPTASSWTRSRRRSPRAPPTRSPRRATPTSPNTAPTSSASGSPRRISGTTSPSRRRSSPTSGETYRLIRNTFRFQLANLFDFDAARDAVPAERMDALDRWALHQAAGLARRLRRGVRRLRVPPRLPALQPVLRGHALGDLPRHPEGPALHARDRAPAAPLVADRDPRHLPDAGEDPRPGHPVHDGRGVVVRGLRGRSSGAGSVHLEDWPADLAAVVAAAGRRRDRGRCSGCGRRVNEAIEPLRAAGRIGKSLDAAVTLSVPKADPLRRGPREAPRLARGDLHRVRRRAIARRPRPGPGGRPVSASACAPAPSSATCAARGAGAGCPRSSAHPLADVCPRCAEALAS